MMRHQLIESIVVGCHANIEDWIITFTVYTAAGGDSQCIAMDQTTPKIAPSRGDLNPIEYNVPWAHLNQPPKWHLNRLSHFCKAYLWLTQTDRPRYVWHL